MDSIWPLFSLTLTTPRLLLRPVRDQDLPAMAAAIASGIHPPDRMPFSTPWSLAPREEIPAHTARFIWKSRAELLPEKWNLTFGIWEGGEFVGAQDLGAARFGATRTVATGSWLRRSTQGRGLGREMRAAVVLYAFDRLGALAAESEAAVWNRASLGVSAALGYRPNGLTMMPWGSGGAQEVQRMRLTPADFRRPAWQLQVRGHDAAKGLLGL